MSAKPKSVHVYRGVRGELFVDQFTMRDAYAPLAVGEYLGEYVPNEELADLRARALPVAIVDAVSVYQEAFLRWSSDCMNVDNVFILEKVKEELMRRIEADAKGGDK